MNAPARQVFSVDVEEYFHVSAFERFVSRDEWPAQESRLEASMDALLELLDEAGVHGTFFILGWVAERFPNLVRTLSGAGHELASHGWWHRRVFTLTPEEFRESITKSKALLEDLGGGPVHGYRAPSFSLLPSVAWAYDILIEEGFLYDSSVFPIRRRNYGNPHAETRAHYVERSAGRILELPVATTRVAGLRLPGAGGAYLRLLPFWLVRRTVREHAERGDHGVFYTHPWELDLEQPRLEVDLPTAIRHYGGLSRTGPRLRRLFDEYDFGPVREVYADMLKAVASSSPTEDLRMKGIG